MSIWGLLQLSLTSIRTNILRSTIYHEGKHANQVTELDLRQGLLVGAAIYYRLKMVDKDAAMRKVILLTNEINIEVDQSLPAGQYILTIQDQNAVKSLKLVKQ